MTNDLDITVNGEPQFTENQNEHTATPEPSNETTPVPSTEVPDKFLNEDGSINAEAVLKSQQELEKRFHESRQNSVDGVTAGAPDATNDPEAPDFASMSDEELAPYLDAPLDSPVGSAQAEFVRNGELSEETFAALEEAGMPRNVVAAYIAAQGNTPDASTATETVATGEASETIASAQAEFTESGELSTATYEALAKAGIPTEVVDNYISNHQSNVAATYNEAYQLAGGSEESYTAMSAWAAEALTPAELEAFNMQVVNDNTWKLAISNLYSRYQSEAPNEPDLVMGNTNYTNDSVAGFQSSVEMQAAMSDPRYQTSADFRLEVARKIAASSAGGLELFG